MNKKKSLTDVIKSSGKGLAKLTIAAGVSYLSYSYGPDFAKWCIKEGGPLAGGAIFGGAGLITAQGVLYSSLNGVEDLTGLKILDKVYK